MRSKVSSPPLSSPAGSSHRTGYLIAVVSAFGGGAATVVGKWNLLQISPLLQNALIFSVATVMLSFWILPRIGVRRIFVLSGKGWLYLLLFSVTSWLAVQFFWAGVQRMDPTLASFLNRAEVMVAILLGILFLRERYNRVESVGVALSLIGIVVMRLTVRGDYMEGFWLVLLGSLFFGMTEFVSKLAVRYVDPILLTYLRNALLAIGFWGVFLIGERSYEGLDRVWPGVIALSFLGPILSRMLYVMALKRLDLSKVAVISQSAPVWVVLIALLVLHQLPTPRESIGGLLLLIGCVVMIAGHRRPVATARGNILPTDGK